MEICKSCPAVAEDDLQAAIGELGAYVDVTAADLLKIYVLAVRHARKRHSTIVPISSIMTAKVVSIAADQNTREAMKRLAESRIKGMPVVDADRKVVGILSGADLPHTDRDNKERRSLLGRLFGTSKKSHQETLVRDIMTSPAITIEPDADIQEVAAMLDLHHIRRLPVVDDEGKLIGIISRGDVIRSLAKKA